MPSNEPVGREFPEMFGGAPYRDGRILVVPSDSTLPPYCVKCGEPAETSLKHTFRWKPFEGSHLIPGSQLIAAFVPGGKIRLDVPFCQLHRSRRTRMTFAATVLLLGFLPAAFLLAWLGAGENLISPVVVIMLLSGIAVVMIAGGPLRPINIDQTRALFKGAGEKFLSRLPTKPG